MVLGYSSIKPDSFRIVFSSEKLLDFGFTITSFLLSKTNLTADCNVIVVINVYAIPIAHKTPKSLIGGIVAERKDKNAIIVVSVARNIPIPTSFIDAAIAFPGFFPFFSSAR